MHPPSKQRNDRASMMASSTPTPTLRAPTLRPRLPPELTDLIVDHLHSSPLALRALALTSHVFLPAARYHTWRSLHLKCTSASLARFATLLDASPAIAWCVRDVVVTQKKGHFCTWDDLTLLHTTLAVLARLPTLAALTLDGLWFGASGPVSESSHEHGTVEGEQGKAGGKRQSAFPCVRKLVVSTCSFDAFDDVRRLCSAFPALRDVHFDGVWWGRWVGQNPRLLQGAALNINIDTEARAAPAHVGALRWSELDLGSCFSRDTVVEWLLDALEEGSVQTLRLPLVSAYDTRLKDLLAFVGPSLRHLAIGSPSTSATRIQNEEGGLHPLESLLDLSTCSALQSITLGVPTYRDPTFITRWLSALLRAAGAAAHGALEEVRFAVYPVLRGDAADVDVMLSAFGWDELVGVLLGSPSPSASPSRPHSPSQIAIPRRSYTHSLLSTSAEGRPFSKLRRITFCAGRAADYAQIPSAFVPLVPFMRRVADTYFKPLQARGVEFAFCDAT